MSTGAVGTRRGEPARAGTGRARGVIASRRSLATLGAYVGTRARFAALWRFAHVVALPIRARVAAVSLAGATLVAGALVPGTPVHAADGTGRQALTTNRLKVCADPANLPFSNEALEGFENRIVALLAEELGLEPRYTWYPQTTGFVRRTLRVRQCDLISGITTTSELVQNTNPYYHSVYTMVYRADSGLEATRMGDPALADRTLGVVAGTPPADVLAGLGLMGRVRPYQLVTDTRRERPAERALEDVASGEIDAAFVWGPIAGHFAKTHPEAELAIVPLLEEDRRVRMNYHVSMAVRYNETEWKRTVNRALEANAEAIEAILRDYGVPLLNERGEPIGD